MFSGGFFFSIDGNACSVFLECYTSCEKLCISRESEGGYIERYGFAVKNMFIDKLFDSAHEKRSPRDLNFKPR